jgi:hypothetical protein
MAVSQAVQDLFKNSFSRFFIQALPLLHVLQKVTAASVFHDHQEMFWAFKDL